MVKIPDFCWKASNWFHCSKKTETPLLLTVEEDEIKTFHFTIRHWELSLFGFSYHYDDYSPELAQLVAKNKVKSLAKVNKNINLELQDIANFLRENSIAAFITVKSQSNFWLEFTEGLDFRNITAQALRIFWYPLGREEDGQELEITLR